MPLDRQRELFFVCARHLYDNQIRDNVDNEDRLDPSDNDQWLADLAAWFGWPRGLLDEAKKEAMRSVVTHPTGARLNLWATLGVAIVTGITAFATSPFLHLVNWAMVTVPVFGAVVGASVVQVFSSSLDRKKAVALVTAGMVVIVGVCLAVGT